jgi:DNA (cytosine-5)-methyltransferase 1
VDVRDIDWSRAKGPVRLIAGAAPCQPFSLGGAHLAEQDERNLFPEVLRAVRELRPAVVLLENVRGLLRAAFQPYFEYLLRQLECPSFAPRPGEPWQGHNDRLRRRQCSLGYAPEYHVSWRLFEAADFGVPQTRQRVFIVAIRDNLPPYRFPSPTHSRTALLCAQRSPEYWDRLGVRKPEVLPGNGLASTENDGGLPWVTVREALSGLPEPADGERGAWMNHWLISGARCYAGHTGSLLDWPSKTIKAGVHGVPGGENTVVLDSGEVRYYTLREAARLQSFADNHYFEGARMHVMRQIGNAVPCKLVEAVARPLYGIASAAAATM